MRVLDVSPPPDYTGAEHVATGLHGPAWEKTQVLVVGTLLARGRRTVAAALRQTGHKHIGAGNALLPAQAAAQGVT